MDIRWPRASNVAAVAIALALYANASAAAVAPADEYFGPFKVSILEIRNRLASFERDTSPHLHANVVAIDNVELDFSARLVRVYVRASHATTVRCASISRIASLTSHR